MKGRSHRPTPSAQLEDWGDGQWTVDCSCGVTFDDGEEMVSCDECGVWVHTRCSRYVRGEVSFACHKCKITSKRSRSVIVSAANNFVHDMEETEVARLLVELPTKTDHPPPAQPIGASYRPPFRLWAHVPMEERVHVQGVPGGDPSLFRGLSSKIFSPELWKCTGYVPKKFNFKYKEFPCWDDDERDKASRGADALFSLSKEIVQATPAMTFDNVFSPDGSMKDREKVLLDPRPFGCVKKERNKVRVLGSHSSKARKEELGEEKDFSGRKRSRGDFDSTLADVKEKVESVPLFDSIKEDLEDGDFQIEESDVPDNKSVINRDDSLLKPSGKEQDEEMGNSKTKNLLVFKTSRRRLPDEALRPKISLEPPVKVEKLDRSDGRASLKLDNAATCHAESRNIAKGFTKQEVWFDCYKFVGEPSEDAAFKQPKGESCVHSLSNGGSTGAVIDLEKKKGDNNHRNGNRPDVPDISSSILRSASTNRVELNVKIEATADQVLENSYFPRQQCGMDDLHQNQLKSMDCSSIVPEESITVMNIQPDVQKPQVMQKDSDLSQSYKECINTAGNDSTLLHEVIMDSAGSLRKCKDSVELGNVSKIFCGTSSMKSNDASPSHSISPVQKVATNEKELLNSTIFNSKPSVSSLQNSSVICGSKSLVSSTQNSTASALSSSPAGKAIHMTKQQRVKVTTPCTGNIDTMMTFASMEENGVLQQPEKVHPTEGESVGSKSLQEGKFSYFSPSRNCSFDSKEEPPGLPCQRLAEKHTTSSGIAEITKSRIQTPSNQLKAASLGSSQKTDKPVQSNTPPATKFISHSLVMHASTSTNAATTLSDEELALLLHQELNSSPRVPRVPRMRQTSTQSSTPSTTSMLSKRAYTGGKDQVSFFRRKHKDDASKNGSCHPRDAVRESKKIGRHSPESKQDELSTFSDGFNKRGKGSRSYDTMTSSKANLSGTSIECANSLSVSSEENGTKTSIRTSQSNVEGTGSLVGLTLPSLIDEIMSKGKCSTYEELCNSVKPYWRSLRKPNGERYAYFSHSQAVLDCLRNRSEWAHLIDRGPKTNASKRKRKLDTETHAMEMEYKKSGSSRREDFPKGKRNVRKRRLLERRQGNTKVVSNTRSSQVTLSDDDHAVLSHSSNEEAECHVSDDTGPEACSSSSGESD